MPTGESPKILITRLSHIGDCILTLPLVSAIRRVYPRAFISWAVESPSQQLLGLHPGIDQLILIPRGWAKKPSCWPKLVRQLRKPAFEIVIDPQGITKSAALGRLSGARRRIGIRGRWGRELSPYLNNQLVTTKSSHLVDRTLELLAALGENGSITGSGVEFGLPVCPISHSKIENFLSGQRLGDRFVVLNPGASWASKRWETDRFAAVASHLFRQHAIQSVVTWAGAEEQGMAQQIHALAPAATVVADQTSLRDLAALCQTANFFLGCDTGPLHIATAMGAPCVGLYGTTRPEESGAYGPQHIAVQKWYQFGNCRARRSAGNQAMRDIQVADVNAAVEQMIARLDSGPISQRRAS